MSCLETYATLRIFSEAIHPAEISRVLGIDATRARHRDANSKYRHERENHYWGWCSDSFVQSLDGIAHVRAIVSVLQGKEQELAQLRTAGCNIDVCCYWVSSGQGGPSLDTLALTDLSRLGLDIGWDVYFGKEEEYAEGKTGNSADGA